MNFINKILRLSQAVVLSKHIYNIYQNMTSCLVPRMGLEPTQAKAQQILSLSCLPIPPSRHHLPS